MAFGYDSTLAAFLRQMGTQEQTIYSENRHRSGMAQRQYARSVPLFMEQEREAVEGVQNDAEARGVYRSGATVRNTALARNQVAMRQQEALASSQDQQDTYALEAARQIAGLRQSAAEQELEARRRQSIAGANATYGGF
jgi:hypothetical protein